MTDHDALMAEVSRVVGEVAGAVSLCWEPRPEGEFDSTQAATYIDGAIARLSSVLSAEEGRIRADERKKHAREMAEASRRFIALRKEMEARVLYAKAEARADERERVEKVLNEAWGAAKAVSWRSGGDTYWEGRMDALDYAIRIAEGEQS